MAEKAEKLSMEAMLGMHHSAREFWNKRFVHKRSGDHYQLLTTAIDTETQKLMAVYCLSAMTQLKYTREFSIFMENFEEIKN